MNDNTDNLTQENESPQNRNILVVDDETLFLKILVRIFEKYFNVRSATSGNQGLEIIKNGYKPGVILTDQRMPGMIGSEFLEETMNYVPEAVRIILTGYTTPKDIIPCVNQGKAFMFLKKPIEEIDLVQAVKIAFDHFNTKLKNIQALAKVRILEKKLGEQVKPNTSINSDNDAGVAALQFISSMPGFVEIGEQVYFKSRINFIMSAARSMAAELNLTDEQLFNVLLGNIISGMSLNSMPLKLRLQDPWEIESEEERNNFIATYKSSVTNFEKIDFLKKASFFAGQIFEHADGSGFPLGLKRNQVAKESELISILSLYHSVVYRMPLNFTEKLTKEGSLIQTPQETKARHDEAVKFFYRKATWFDFDIFQTFHDFVKKRSIPEFIPDDKQLIISTKMINDLTNVREKITVPDNELNTGDNFGIPKNKDREKLIEVEVSGEKLEEGMLISHNIVTKSGMLVVRQDTKLDKNMVSNIRQLERTKNLKEAVIVLVPSDFNFKKILSEE
jgi:response regulator RpfG family c-di-GMP phosphodiesterase